jgi:hypothetical protein
VKLESERSHKLVRFNSFLASLGGGIFPTVLNANKPTKAKQISHKKQKSLNSNENCFLPYFLPFIS